MAASYRRPAVANAADIAAVAHQHLDELGNNATQLTAVMLTAVGAV
ncbi:hypothetical protein ACH4D3_13135 [Streptomyces sp. NPDC018026]